MPRPCVRAVREKGRRRRRQAVVNGSGSQRAPRASNAFAQPRRKSPFSAAQGGQERVVT